MTIYKQYCLECGELCDITKGELVHVTGWYHDRCSPRIMSERVKLIRKQTLMDVLMWSRDGIEPLRKLISEELAG